MFFFLYIMYNFASQLTFMSNLKLLIMSIFDNHKAVLKYIEEHHVNYYPCYFLAKDCEVLQVSQAVADTYACSGGYNNVYVFKYSGRNLVCL